MAGPLPDPLTPTSLLKWYLKGCFWWHGLIVIILVAVYKHYFSKSPYRRFRRFGRPWYLSMLPSKPVHELVAQGYHENNDEPFVIRWWARDWVVLPSKYLLDMKHSQSTSLSFFRAIDEAVGLHYSVGNLYHSQKMAEIVKKAMNTQLPTLTGAMVDETKAAFDAHIGKPKEWVEIPVSDIISSLVNQVASRILIGPELCRDAAFQKASLKFMESIFIHAMITILLPFGPLRAFFARLISLSHRRNLGQAMKMLQPVAEQRIQKRKSGDSKSNLNDGIEWTLNLTDEKAMEPYQLSLEILHNLFAGSLAPGAMVTELVFQAMMDPKLLEDLRTEARNATEKYGWTEKLLTNLPLQDSFIRELNRVFPTGSTGCSRMVMDKSFTFHDGLSLPAGTLITFPIQAILNDEKHYDNPTQFDAYRFFKMRNSSAEDEGNEYQWAASTASPTNLAFGYGKHACPGRFYCIRQCKAIFTKLIVEYELEWPTPMRERPARAIIEGQFGSNKAQKIRVRRC